MKTVLSISILLLTGRFMGSTNMASSPSSPGSPTGTLTRESSRKDSGKLGWVGTLTRRKKGQEGKLFRSNIETFCFDILWKVVTVDMNDRSKMSEMCTTFCSVLSCIARVDKPLKILYSTVIRAFNAVDNVTNFIDFQWKFENIKLWLCRNSTANSNTLSHPFLFYRGNAIL